MSIFDPSLRLGANEPGVSGLREAELRLRMVLETRPGTLPWRPEFGCDLHPFLGQAATPEVLNSIDWTVREALARWVPDLKVVSSAVATCPLDELDDDNAGTSTAGTSDATALRGTDSRTSGSNHAHLTDALFALGTQVGVRVSVRVQTNAGVADFGLDLAV